MASGMDKLAKELKTMMTASDDRKPKPYDTQAEVLRVEDGVAWVHIPGGVQETPVRLTMDAKKGDMVNVHVAGGSAWITGNSTSPPTDDTVANKAQDTAAKAMTIGEMAMDDATRARVAADTAEAQAQAAGISAENAQGAASNAQASAESAQQSANIAFNQLGVVENIVGVLDLISKNGTYELTEDTEVVQDKWYFTRSGTSPNYIYGVVPNPTGDPNAQGWYELTAIQPAIKNYVSSHLVLDEQGLWLKQSGTDSKIQISTNGVTLYAPNGRTIGQYGSTAIVGDPDYMHITMTGTRLSFWDGLNEVAYIDGQQLYITKTVVLKQMDLGRPAPDDLGQWSWKVHPNSETPARNNLNLKWIG